MAQFTLPDPQPSETLEGTAAVAEAAAVAAGTDLSDRVALNRVKKLLRDDKREDHIHNILVVSLWFGSGLVLLMFGCLVWNMSVAQWLRFLSPEQILTLQQFLFSGFVGGAITAAGKRLKGSEE